MKVTVLLVTGPLDVGGAERHLLAVTPRLVAAGYRILVFTLLHPGSLAPRFERAGVRVLSPPCGSFVSRLPGALRTLIAAPLSVFALLAVIWRYRPEIVHFFLPSAYLIGAACAIFSGCHLRVMSRRSLDAYRRRRRIYVIEKWFHPWMSAVLGNSSAVLDQLFREGVPVDRAGLIYNGIDMREFDGLASREALRSGLGIEGEALVLVMVANLIAYKGHADLLAALAGIRQRFARPWVLLLVGEDAGEGAALEACATALGLGERVRFMGLREDVAEILGAADIGVLCSHEEGFSNSVIEGMAAGLPMVVTDVGGNREAVEDGISGVVVPAHAPELLGEALLRFAEDQGLRRRFGEAARCRVSECFTLERCVARYQRLYRALMAGPVESVPATLDGEVGR